jgi:hypothetical protein
MEDSPYTGPASWIFYQRSKWSRSFAWLPHRCLLSNRLIWFRFGMCGLASYWGPDGMYPRVVECHWHDCIEHAQWVLEGSVPKNYVFTGQ